MNNIFCFFQPTFTLSSEDIVYWFSVYFLKELIPDFQGPSTKLNSKYFGKYNFWLKWKNKKIHINIKSLRVVDFEKSKGPSYVEALSSKSKRPFDMNFQQIKPECTDVFLWIGIWRDKIRYWILNSNEIVKNKYFSKGQHRGNVGEGQLHLNQNNITEFKKYEVSSSLIKQGVVESYKRLK